MPKVRVKQDDFKPRNQGRPIPLAASVRLSRSTTKDANGAMIACVEIGHGMTVAGGQIGVVDVYLAERTINAESFLHDISPISEKINTTAGTKKPHPLI